MQDFRVRRCQHGQRRCERGASGPVSPCQAVSGGSGEVGRGQVTNGLASRRSRVLASLCPHVQRFIVTRRCTVQDRLLQLIAARALNGISVLCLYASRAASLGKFYKSEFISDFVPDAPQITQYRLWPEVISPCETVCRLACSPYGDRAASLAPIRPALRAGDRRASRVGRAQRPVLRPPDTREPDPRASDRGERGLTQEWLHVFNVPASSDVKTSPRAARPRREAARPARRRRSRSATDAERTPLAPRTGDASCRRSLILIAISSLGSRKRSSARP